MGSGTNRPEQHRKYEARYALDNADGVRLLLSEWHALIGRQFQGDYAAVDILVDLATAIERASLTDRQRQALELVYVEDLTQKEAGVRIGVRREAIKRHIEIAETKIARVFEYWSRHGEGYSLSTETEENNA